jgi:hypothetical protein
VCETGKRKALPVPRLRSKSVTTLPHLITAPTDTHDPTLRRTSIGHLPPSKSGLLSPLIEAPTLPGDSPAPTAGPDFFPLCSNSLVLESGSEGDGDSETGGTGPKGVAMRSGCPKSLPPLLARPRSRSMDHDISEGPLELDLTKNQRQRAHSICLNPLLDCDLTPRGKYIASSWGHASFPVSILKTSTEKLHAASPVSNRKLPKVTFKDFDATAMKQDSTDSGNEDDFVPTDEESAKKDSEMNKEENEDRGFCTVVHSFTPRPKKRGQLIRPSTPMGLYESDIDVDEEVTTDEDVETLIKQFTRGKDPRTRNVKSRGSASSSSSSNSSSPGRKKKPTKPFRC